LTSLSFWISGKSYTWDVEKIQGPTKRIWTVFNELITKIDLQEEEKIQNYDNFYRIGEIGMLRKIKIKVLQGMIQIERPVNWSIVNIIKIVNEIKWMEIYNSKLINKIGL
jgi:hypothetical protein